MILHLQMVIAALVISMDTFAVALALGTRTQKGDRQRIAVAFALLGGATPAAGLLVGQVMSGWIGTAAGWLSAGILILLALWLLEQARESQPGRVPPPAQPLSSTLREELGPLPNEGRGIRFRPPVTGLVLMSLGLSLDNVLLGFGFGLRGGGALLLGVLAGLFIFASTHLGLHLGRLGRLRFGRWALAGAGVLLLVVAVGILIGEV